MGGGVMRTAGKAAAIGGAYRNAFGRSTSAVGRRSTVSAPTPSASSAVADSAPISIHLDESSKGLNESANPTLSQLERLDDWEFAGWRSEDDYFEHAPTRLVFGPVPTLEEAQEATGDLTKALERANEDGQIGTFPSNAILPAAMPRGVAQAFSLLQSSPEAQTVVASLASDKNVWEAVMKNQKVLEFCRSHQSIITENIFEDSFKTDENNIEETPNKAGEETLNQAEEAPQGSNGFAEVLNSVKVKTMEIVNSISDFIQDIFGAKTEANSSEADSKSGFQSFITPNTFYALAMAVILIVLLKRA